MRIDTPFVLAKGLVAWYISVNMLSVNLGICLLLKCVSCKNTIDGIVFFNSLSIFVLFSGMFRPLTLWEIKVGAFPRNLYAIM